MELPKFIWRKIIFSLLPALWITQTIAWLNMNNEIGLVFLISYVFYFSLLLKLDNRQYIRYYSFNTIRLLLFFLPITAIIFSFVVTSFIANETWSWAAAIWWALWWFVAIILSLIIWLVWWLIVWLLNKKVEFNEEDKKITWFNQSIIFAFIIVLVLIIWLPSNNNSWDIQNIWNSNIENNQVKDLKNEENIKIISKIKIMDKKISDWQFWWKDLVIKLENNTWKEIDWLRIKASFKNNFGESITSFWEKFFNWESQELLWIWKSSEYIWNIFWYDKATSIDTLEIYQIHFKWWETIDIK